MADRETIVSMTTDAIRQEFTDIISRLVAEKNRESRVALFDASIKEASDGARKLFDLSKSKERQHIDHVRRTLDSIDEHPKDRLAHDFSKDDLYMFVTSAKFDYGIDADVLDGLFRIETERHYRLERHHEQHELFDETDSDADDIREMAIDRMSRNMQANGGSLVVGQLEQYVPRFPRGDDHEKGQLFRHYLVFYKDLVEKTYGQLTKP